MAGFFDTLFGGGAEREAADKNRMATNQYGVDAQGYLKTGYDTGVTNLNKAVGAYTPLSDLGAKYNMGGDLYRDALGINGPEGNVRASGAFTTSPGYAKGIEAGMDVINRRRGGASMGTSGNADLDALQFAQNSQNQQYNSWLQNLAGVGQTGAGLTGQAAAGEAGGYTNLSNLAGQYASGQSGVAGNVLSGNVSANTLQAQGEAAGAKNLLGAGLSVAQLAMGIPPTGMGGGGGGGGQQPFSWGQTPIGQAASGAGNWFKNLNVGNSIFGGGSPTGYGVA